MSSKRDYFELEILKSVKNDNLETKMESEEVQINFNECLKALSLEYPGRAISSNGGYFPVCLAN